MSLKIKGINFRTINFCGINIRRLILAELIFRDIFDDISVKMIKLCLELISIPLKIIFDKCIQQGTFPNVWKTANGQPVHKQEQSPG